MKTHPLDQEMEVWVKRYLQDEAQIITSLQKIQKDFVFRQLGYSSLFQYCVQRHKLSESRAGELIYVSRKCTEVPKLKEAIENGTLNISKARRIGSVVKTENVEMWIEKAAELKQRDLEREVANEKPAKAVNERVKPISKDRSMLVVGISLELDRDIQRLREVVAQSSREACSIGIGLQTAVREFLDRHDPVRKAERILAKKDKAVAKVVVEGTAKDASVIGAVAIPVNSVASHSARIASAGLSPRDGARNDGGFTFLRNAPSRSKLPAHIKHAVAQRDRGMCRGKLPDGTPCRSRHWVEIHHVIPVALGGTNALENLITLCSAHHAQVHRSLIPRSEREFGGVSRRNDGRP